MEKIAQLRSQIDQIHHEMAELICQRLKIAEEIWSTKKIENLSTTDSQREEILLNLFENSNQYSDAEKKVLRKIFETTILETKKYLNEKQ